MAPPFNLAMPVPRYSGIHRQESRRTGYFTAPVRQLGDTIPASERPHADGSTGLQYENGIGRFRIRYRNVRLP